MIEIDVDIYKFNEKIFYSIMLLRWWIVLILKKWFIWKEKIVVIINYNVKEFDM